MAMMPDYRAIEKKIQEILASPRQPVAMSFADAAPPGVPRLEGSQPSSCSFWRLAAAGHLFYTVPQDHFNCPIGSYTHNTLAPERMSELEKTLKLMSGIGYIRMEEISGVFQLEQKPSVIVYAPLGDTPGPPAVILASGKPGRLMMLVEAANRARVPANFPLLGRPTCMAIPAAVKYGMVTSAGCIGNRVYTEIGDDELYVMLRGQDAEALAAEIDTILAANQTLTQYHQQRRSELTVL